jgi:hypothetical protein
MVGYLIMNPNAQQLTANGIIRTPNHEFQRSKFNKYITT